MRLTVAVLTRMRKGRREKTPERRVEAEAMAADCVSLASGFPRILSIGFEVDRVQAAMDL